MAALRALAVETQHKQNEMQKRCPLAMASLAMFALFVYYCTCLGLSIFRFRSFHAAFCSLSSP